MEGDAEAGRGWIRILGTKRSPMTAVKSSAEIEP